METGTLRMNLDVDTLELFCDPALEMMFSHLIKETLKNRKTKPEIRISFAEIPEGVLLTYEDNGAGIPHSRKKNLFTETIIKADNFCLKFVHDILEFSGMDIKETGDPEKGSRFDIMVPHGAYRFTETHGTL
jgi:signal transduction histidine kinase